MGKDTGLRLLLVSTLALLMAAVAPPPLEREPPPDPHKEAQPRPSEAELAAILMAMSRGEREAARLTLQRSQEEHVRALAERILREQREVDDWMGGASEDLYADPVESEILRGLGVGAAQGQHELAARPPAQFDRDPLHEKPAGGSARLRSGD